MLLKQKGFTLIELLVVISIIALLIAILMPALNLARESAKAVVCSTNLKQIATAWVMYADDNEDHITGSWNNTPARHGAGDPSDWAWAPWKVDGRDIEADAIPLDASGNLDPMCTDKEKQEGAKRGSLYKYLDVVDIYHCPSDRINFRSYSIPDCLGGHWGPSQNWKNYTKASLIRMPSTKYLFLEESDIRGYNMNAWAIFPDTMEWCDPLTVWHNGRSSLAYADGHVDARAWSDETVDAFLDPISFGGFHPVTEEGLEDLEWMLRGWAD